MHNNSLPNTPVSLQVSDIQSFINLFVLPLTELKFNYFIFTSTCHLQLDHPEIPVESHFEYKITQP